VHEDKNRPVYPVCFYFAWISLSTSSIALSSRLFPFAAQSAIILPIIEGGYRQF
jgi:hypothetical protein